MQPFGENVYIFGHGGNPDCPDLPNLPNGTNNTTGLSGFSVPGIGLPSEWANSEAIATPFPSLRPTINNRFVNQDDALFDEGYDSEGGLPFHNDIKDGAAEEYDEAAIGGGATEAPPPIAVSSYSSAD